MVVKKNKRKRDFLLLNNIYLKQLLFIYGKIFFNR